MTTNIKVGACCPDDTLVEVTICHTDVKDQIFILEDGQTHEDYVCGDRTITVKEIDKE